MKSTADWRSTKQHAMRNGQNKRMRGRNNNRKSQNPLTRIYESNGPDVKIRGTASHVADKYVQLARDAQSSGDPVAAENYYQHAEHYFRLIAAVQEQFRQNSPYYRENEANGYEDSDEGSEQIAGEPYAPREQAQPYFPREQQYQNREGQGFSQPREYSQQREPQRFNREQAQPYAQSQPAPADEGDIERLPAFVTGNGAESPAPNNPPFASNGYEGGGPDRFPLHRRRRRRHGPRGEAAAMGGAETGGAAGEPPTSGE